MMRLLSPILARVAANQGYGLMFYCPGCKEDHCVWVGEGDRPRWGYNNNPEKPTFTPSILVRSGHFTDGFNAEEDSCWCNWNLKERDSGFKCVVCHSFVVEGVIQFLPDCTHELAGQSVPIPAFPHGTFVAKPSPYPPRKEQQT